MHYFTRSIDEKAIGCNFCSLFAADTLSKKGMAGSFEVEYSSAKPLTQGMNIINIKVKENGKEIKDAKVSVTVSIPAMEQSSEAMFVNGAYMALWCFQ